MAYDDITIAQYDTARTLNYVLTVTSGSSNVAVDITDATASLHIKRPDGLILERSTTLVSATSGSVKYDLVDEDTAVNGLARLQFVVDFDDGTVLRVPTTDYIYMVIKPAI
jgi:hypothetical protein